MKRLLHSVIVAAFLIAACTGEPPVAPPVHELSPDEQAKARLDDSFIALWEATGLTSLEDAVQYVTDHGRISVKGRSVTGTLDSSSGEIFRIKVTLIEKYSLLSVEGSAPLGMTFSGTIAYKFLSILADLSLDPIGKADALSGAMDITVFDSGKPLCKTGVTASHRTGAEEDSWSYVPVFRFEDGTTYGIMSVLLVQPLVEQILKNEALAL